MLIRFAAFGVSALLLSGVPAAADPGDYREDYRKKHWETVADCDKKLDEAKARREFRQKAFECDRELAKLDDERRREAAKKRREAEKKWRERHHDGPNDDYGWDD
ncbi:hypothetical protein [Sphingopyxis chilensis]